MKSKYVVYKKTLLASLLVIFFLPLLQGSFKLLPKAELHGAFAEPRDTTFTLSGWFSGTYQQNKETYLSQSFGLRSLFIRTHNEIALDLFHKVYAKGVIIGKENYLYEENYIKAYYGIDFIGKDSISNRMKKLKFIQDTLASLNKTFLLVFAAGKGSFYPDHFPDKYQYIKGITNYEYSLEKAKELSINYIDFNKYFIENKNRSAYPLYPKYGIHWSYYAECLVADSITRYIENIRHIHMPHIYWNKVNVRYPQRYERDMDVEDGLNLIFRFKKEKMAYPDILFQTDSGKTKPTSIVIADSYYWGMHRFNFPSVFSNSSFWFYNQTAYNGKEFKFYPSTFFKCFNTWVHLLVTYPERYKSPLEVPSLNLKEQVDSSDVIIIMATEPSLANLGWGSIENMYTMFKGIKPDKKLDSLYLQKLNTIKNYIKSDKNWLSQIETGAKKEGISLDSAITANAKWVIEHEKGK